MFVNYAKQIYTELIKQDYNPFIANINDVLSDKTMSLGLVKVTSEIIYVVNILNAYNYQPDALIGKVSIDRSAFNEKYKHLTIRNLNIFISNDDKKCITYINNIDENKLQKFDTIYWSVCIKSDNISLYANKNQPNKLFGIEKIIKSLNKNIKNDNLNDLKTITAKAVYESPLRAKFSFFKFYYIIIAINIIIFLSIYLSSGITSESLLYYGAFSYDRIVHYKEYYRLFTCIFLHGSFAHLFSNMLTLYIFGRGIETTTSHTNFLATYFLSGIAANTLLLIFPSNSIMVGASGCIFGLIGSTLVLTYYFNKSIYGLNFNSILSLTMLNIFISVVVPEISLSVHLIGLILGVIIGYFYAIDIRNLHK